ncbi:MAG: hypothetical protein ABIF11_06695 [Nitrospirota bacterium]
MSILFRKLERKVYMDPQKANELGGPQADALKNFKTKENALSVYEVENELTDIERILAAIAGTRDNVQEVEYASFDSNLLAEHEIKTNKIKGDTADDEVNNLHIDLIDLTAKQLYLLASSIQKDGKLIRILKKEIGIKITEGLKEGYLDKNKINEKLLHKLAKYAQNSC